MTISFWTNLGSDPKGELPNLRARLPVATAESPVLFGGPTGKETHLWHLNPARNRWEKQGGFWVPYGGATCSASLDPVSTGAEFWYSSLWVQFGGSCSRSGDKKSPSEIPVKRVEIPQGVGGVYLADGDSDGDLDLAVKLRTGGYVYFRQDNCPSLLITQLVSP